MNNIKNTLWAITVISAAIILAGWLTSVVWNAIVYAYLHGFYLTTGWAIVLWVVALLLAMVIDVVKHKT